MKKKSKFLDKFPNQKIWKLKFFKLGHLYQKVSELRDLKILEIFKFQVEKFRKQFKKIIWKIFENFSKKTTVNFWKFSKQKWKMFGKFSKNCVFCRFWATFLSKSPIFVFPVKSQTDAPLTPRIESRGFGKNTLIISRRP